MISPKLTSNTNKKDHSSNSIMHEDNHVCWLLKYYKKGNSGCNDNGTLLDAGNKNKTCRQLLQNPQIQDGGIHFLSVRCIKNYPLPVNEE